MRKEKRIIKIPLILPIAIVIIIVNVMTVFLGKNLITNSARYIVSNTNSVDSEGYYISTAQELWDFAAEVNNGNTFSGITVYLTTDINLECNSDNQWIPIGNCQVDGGNNAEDTTEKNPFGGVFEGNNHTISGVYIDSESNYMGLFGYNEGTIQNLKLKDSYIKSNKAYIAGISAFNIRNNKKLS